MAQTQTSTPVGAASSLLPFAFAVAGCLLAAGLSLFWMVWADGGMEHWNHLLPAAVMGGLCGLLAARLLPLRRAAKPAWLHLCMHCHAVTPAHEKTDAAKQWLPVDQYLEKSFNVEVSHGICPNCLGEHYGQHTAASKPGAT